MKKSISAILKILIFAVGLFITFVLIRAMFGKEIPWIELIIQTLVTSIIIYGLDWIYKKRENKKQKKNS